MATISILLPVYNGSRHLRTAIESVLAQTFADWELIICDDCSTDSSFELAQAYAKKDARIKAYRNPANIGLFPNYNRCLEIAQQSGPVYIKPFAQDDFLRPEALSRLSAVLDQHKDVRLVSCAKNWIGDDGLVTSEIRPFKTDRKIPGDDVVIYNLILLTNWVGEPSTVMFRAERAGAGFDTELFHYGDVEYWFRIVLGGQFYYLDEVLCGFRRHDSSATSRNLKGLYYALDILRLGKIYRPQLEELGESVEQFHRRAVEAIALNLDHMVRGEGLTIEAIQATHVKRPSRAQSRSGLAHISTARTDALNGAIAASADVVAEPGIFYAGASSQMSGSLGAMAGSSLSSSAIGSSAIGISAIGSSSIGKNSSARGVAFRGSGAPARRSDRSAEAPGSPETSFDSGLLDFSPGGNSSARDSLAAAFAASELQQEPAEREEGFREVAFYALRYVTELIRQLSDLEHRTAAERAHLERELTGMKESTCWKITAPLRQLLRAGREG